MFWGVVVVVAIIIFFVLVRLMKQDQQIGFQEREMAGFKYREWVSEDPKRTEFLDFMWNGTNFMSAITAVGLTRETAFPTCANGETKRTSNGS